MSKTKLISKGDIIRVTDAGIYNGMILTVIKVKGEWIDVKGEELSYYQNTLGLHKSQYKKLTKLELALK